MLSSPSVEFQPILFPTLRLAHLSLLQLSLSSIFLTSPFPRLLLGNFSSKVDSLPVIHTYKPTPLQSSSHHPRGPTELLTPTLWTEAAIECPVHLSRLLFSHWGGSGIYISIYATLLVRTDHHTYTHTHTTLASPAIRMSKCTTAFYSSGVPTDWLIHQRVVSHFCIFLSLNISISFSANVFSTCRSAGIPSNSRVKGKGDTVHLSRVCDEHIATRTQNPRAFLLLVSTLASRLNSNRAGDWVSQLENPSIFLSWAFSTAGEKDRRYPARP